MAQYLALSAVLRHSASNVGPESGGMVEFKKMAQLMHDDIVGNLLRKKENFVVEIEIPALGAASPAAFVVLYKYFAYGYAVELIEMCNACVHKLPRKFFMLKIVRAAASRP